MGRLLGSLPLLSAFAGVVAVGGGACGPDNVQLQEVPPEITAVAADYEQPTGTVPADKTQAIADVQQRLDELSQTQLGQLVSDALASLRRRLDGGGFSPDPDATPKKHRATIEAQLTATRICRGWDDASTTPDAATNGSIELIAQVRASVLDKGIFGTASACRGSVALTDNITVHPYVDGTLGILLYGPLPTSYMDARFLVTWDGTLGTEKTGQKSSAFDFRVLYPQVEVRIDVPDGTIIGSVGLNGISLRGHNGTFETGVQ